MIPQQKITIPIDISPVNAGYIDVLIAKGLFASRTEFIQYAIQKELEHHQLELNSFVAEQERQQTQRAGIELVVGATHYTDQDLIQRMAHHAVCQKLLVIGQLDLRDVTNVAILYHQIQTIHVFGRLLASSTVTAHYQHPTNPPD